MPFDADQVLKAINLYEKQATAEELDPKAKIRNRGNVCVSAEQAKDHQDHFPINSENQARNALSRVHQYNTVPPWYNGSLKGLQSLVSSKVHSKYPGIDKEKKSTTENLIAKYSQAQNFVEQDPSEQPLVPFSTGANKPQLANKPQQVSDPKIKQLQTILRFTYKLPGQDGQPLTTDGKMGPNTRFALQSFKTEYNMPQASDAVAMERVLHTEDGGKITSTYGGKQTSIGETLPTANSTTLTRPNIPEVNAIVDAIKNGQQWLETASVGGINPQQIPQMIHISQSLIQLATQLWNSQGQAGKTLFDQANKMAQDIWSQAKKIKSQHKHHPRQNKPVARPANQPTQTTASTIENLITKYAEQEDPELKMTIETIQKAQIMVQQAPSGKVNQAQVEQMLADLYELVPILKANLSRVITAINQVKKVSTALWKLSGKEPQDQ